MRYALNIPNFGDVAEPKRMATLAAAVEAGGWDGLFVWDHIAPQFPPGCPHPTADVTVLLTVIASATHRIRFGALVTPLARRRPQKVARECVSLDRLSGGRLVLGVGLGVPPDTEFAVFGDDPDADVRAARLDESLTVITGLWSGKRVDLDGAQLHVHTERFLPPPVQTPRIPVWVAATWPGHPAPLRRAARWDGVVPISVDLSGETALSPNDIRRIRAEVGRDDEGFEVVVSPPPDADPATYASAGATWWQQTAMSYDAAMAAALNGPPQG